LHVESDSSLHGVFYQLVHKKQYAKENDLVKKYVESDNSNILYARYCVHDNKNDRFRLVDKLHETFGTGPTGRYAFDTRIDPKIVA
jgi:predicted site-specific integrase-resolvase